MSEENNTVNEELPPKKLALILNNHVVEILSADESMFDLFMTHNKVVDVTDKVVSGAETPELLINKFYDEGSNSFRPERPYPSWNWDGDISGWIPPVLMPTDGKDYIWMEQIGNWTEISNSGVPLIAPENS
jgi:hypothetical protein